MINERNERALFLSSSFFDILSIFKSYLSPVIKWGGFKITDEIDFQRPDIPYLQFIKLRELVEKTTIREEGKYWILFA